MSVATIGSAAELPLVAYGTISPGSDALHDGSEFASLHVVRGLTHHRFDRSASRWHRRLVRPAVNAARALRQHRDRTHREGTSGAASRDRGSDRVLHASTGAHRQSRQLPRPARCLAYRQCNRKQHAGPVGHRNRVISVAEQGLTKPVAMPPTSARAGRTPTDLLRAELVQPGPGSKVSASALLNDCVIDRMHYAPELLYPAAIKTLFPLAISS